MAAELTEPIWQTCRSSIDYWCLFCRRELPEQPTAIWTEWMMKLERTTACCASASVFFLIHFFLYRKPQNTKCITHIHTHKPVRSAHSCSSVFFILSVFRVEVWCHRGRQWSDADRFFCVCVHIVIEETREHKGDMYAFWDLSRAACKHTWAQINNTEQLWLHG